MYIADLHIHSRFSRATSREGDLPHLDLWVGRKGIRVVGTGTSPIPPGVRNCGSSSFPPGKVSIPCGTSCACRTSPAASRPCL